jgi:hypothetical protein
MARLLGGAGQHIGSPTYVRLRELTMRPGMPVRCPAVDWPLPGCRPAAASPKAAAAGAAGYGRLTGPVALMTWCHASGGWLCVHLPPERALMARMFSL